LLLLEDEAVPDELVLPTPPFCDGDSDDEDGDVDRIDGGDSEGSDFLLVRFLTFCCSV